MRHVLWEITAGNKITVEKNFLSPDENFSSTFLNEIRKIKENCFKKISMKVTDTVL